MIAENLKHIRSGLQPEVNLIAVSKTKPEEDIMQAYAAGQRHFGENKILEMARKHDNLPKDIKWHMIGHVQTNKVKHMAKFVHLIHAVDSLKLLKEIHKRAKNETRVIQVLLQLKIAEEDSKFGLDKEELLAVLKESVTDDYSHVQVIGLMGMATFTQDESQISLEFTKLEDLYFELKDKYAFTSLSMGMSGDYPIALRHRSNMIRVGSKIFGERNYK